MRARWLKPEFFRDRKMGELGPMTAIVFQALWCSADDGGTAICDPEHIKGEMFSWWSAVGVPEITGALRHLCRTSRIRCYRIGDTTYAVITNWRKHQFVHKPSKFRYPVAGEAVSYDSAAPVREPTGTTTGDPPILDTQTPRLPDSNIGQAQNRAMPESDDLSEPPSDEKKPRTAKTVLGKPTCDAGWEAWTRHIGVVDYGRFRKALKPLLESDHCPEPEQLAEAVLCWQAELRSQPAGRRGFYHINAFANRITEFLELARMPFQAEDGTLTKKGELLTRPGA